MTSIPFYLQYYVERDRSTLYQWMLYVMCVGALAVYGLIFHWVPRFLRPKRGADSLSHKRYFAFVRAMELFNSTFHFTIPVLKKKVYFQPSLIFIFSIFMGINAYFCVARTVDIDYLPQQYVIAKRIGRICVGNLPTIYLLVIKNDLLTAVTGFQHDRLVLLHKWIARMAFVLAAFHIGFCMKYWLKLGFIIMLIIPPQIFGYIATTAFLGLTFGSFKFIRRFAYDAFLIQHRVFSFIFLLLVFFHHRKSTTGAVILAVHQLVLDRIVSRVLALVHKRMGPTKGKSTFDILDDETLLVTIPVKTFPFHERPWWSIPLPKCNTWKAGQHVYLTVSKISYMQMHPFTIASLSDSGDIKLVIRVQKGFTKKLMDRVVKFKEMKHARELEESDSSTASDRSGSSFSVDVETELMGASESSVKKDKKKKKKDQDDSDPEIDGDNVVLKAQFVGPVGGRYLPLITFDSVVMFCVGSGASFCFPVALDLLRTMEERNAKDDFLGRNPNQTVRIVWAIKHVANLSWYKFILDELVTFADKGLLTLDVHLTQDKALPYTGATYIEKEIVSVEGTSHQYEITDKKAAVNEITKRETTSSFESRGDVYTEANVNYILGRPNAVQTISDYVHANASGGQNLKSVAVLSCGLSAFTHTIKDTCQKLRWERNAPDIYCYTESFD